MNDMRDYYLKNLGIGEIWQLRQSDLPASPALTELAAGEVDADTISSVEMSATMQPLMQVLMPALMPSTIIQGQPDKDGESRADWQTLQSNLQQCQACSFCAKFGKGMLGSSDTSASILVITDWASPDNSIQLDPLLQQSEKLMSNILAALLASENRAGASLAKLTVYRTSLLKAQISDTSQVELNVASADAVNSCLHFLHQQIHLVKPRVLLVFGEQVARRLLGVDASRETKMRQAQHQYREIPVIVTHDTHFLLTHPEAKYEVWQDLCRLKQL